MKTYNYYYLLYKTITDLNYWIVDQNDTKSYLLSKIKNYKNSEGNYYIVKQKNINYEEILNKINSEFKRFEKFKFNKNSNIIYKTSKNFLY